MTEDLEITFALPEGNHDLVELAEMVYDKGYTDALIGVGAKEFFCVTLGHERAKENIIKQVISDVLEILPRGSEVHNLVCKEKILIKF